MKPRTWMWMPVVSLFAALAMPSGMAAQNIPFPNNQPKHHTYRLIDPGTFGGPNSFYFSQPVVESVNNRGTVVGGADTSLQDPYYPNCDTPDCLILRAFQWKDGVLTDLGTLPHGFSSTAYWVNDTGLIMGGSENGDIDPTTGIPENIAVVWKHGAITSLGTLGGSFSFGNAMNNRGQIVGLALNAIPDPYSYIGLGTQTRAFLWDKGVMRDLGTLGGPDGWAASINESGQVAGWAYTNSTPNPVTGVPTQHPFLWTNGKMRDLGTLGGTLGYVGANFGSGGGLNSRGQVIGTSNLAGDLTSHPFLWDRGALTDIGTLGGANGIAFWLNDAGDVVGQADLPGSGTQLHHGFLWKHGAMTDLGTLAGDPCSRALVMNSKGQIGGASTNCTEFLHAFLWENGGPMVDLNSLVSPASTMTLITVNYINDRGEIAATGVFPNGDHDAVVLVPDGICDEGCEAGIAARQNSATSAPHVATMTRDSESSLSPVEKSRNQMRQRYHTPGQAAPRNN